MKELFYFVFIIISLFCFSFSFENNYEGKHLFDSYKLHSKSSEDDFMLLLKSADLGYFKAQHELSAAYFTGVSRGLLPVDTGRALLLSYFAALSGDATSHMTLGYRYLFGEGVPESCETALIHYEYAANEAALQIEKRGYALQMERNRLSDDTAAAVRSSGASGTEIDVETLDYFSQLAEDGDMNSAMTLATIYSNGHKNIPINMQNAVKYLTIAADSGWQNAQAQLGYLLATAPHGVKPDPQKAFSLLTMADKRQDSIGTVGLGYCYFKGIGTEVNLTRAYDLLQKVAGKHVDAAFYLGEILMGVDPGNHESSYRVDIPPGDLQAAVQYYSQAASRGHILATHRLGHLQSYGQGIPRSCRAAVQSFKIVAERGDWISQLSDAYNLYENGETIQALITYSIYATMGIETAQANAAFILAKGMCPIPLGLIPIEDMANRGVYFNSTQWYLNFTTETNLEAAYIAACEARALSLYRQSAVQGNADGYLKVGDMHYYGMGGLPKDKKNAALYYQMAADMRHTHAMFNLGLMHEAGDGVDQDFHLAKRYYDQVAEFDKEAQLPSFLAVSFLQFHKSFQTRFGKETSDHIGDILIMLSTPLNIVSKIKNLPIVRRALGKYSGEIAFLHSGGNKISDFAENTWSFAVYFKGYCERFIDRMKKSPFGTLAIIFRSDPKTSTSSSTTSPTTTTTTPPPKKSNTKSFIESENETLILLVLTGLFIVFLDIRRQRARRRQVIIEENGLQEFIEDEEGNENNHNNL